MTDMEKVIEGLETIKQFFGYGLPSTAEMFDSYYGILNDAISLLKEQDNCENCAIAIEDRQPIVRCKDCKYYTEKAFENNGVNYGECHKLAIGLGAFTVDDWFCASAERRTDDA